jgi:hypothetical protein
MVTSYTNRLRLKHQRAFKRASASYLLPTLAVEKKTGAVLPIAHKLANSRFAGNVMKNFALNTRMSGPSSASAAYVCHRPQHLKGDFVSRRSI